MNIIPPPNNTIFPKFNPLPPPQTPQLPPVLQCSQELQVEHALQLLDPVHLPAKIGFADKRKNRKIRRKYLFFIESIFL
jgi:hypothetical protein